ncbi:MAG: YrdB family protein [Actinomycetes bacterium]
MKMLNLTVRFLLEMCALTALAAWGWQAADRFVLRVLLAVAAPLVAAVAWGAWVSPRAARRLPDPARLAVEALVFAAATAALLSMEHVTLAVALAVIYVVNVALLFVLRQREL